MKLSKHFYALFIVGIILRIGLSYHLGNRDMIAYVSWGTDVLRKGLLDGYQGIYFPIQYQLFALGAWITFTFNIRWIIIFKLFNLFFEIGVFVLLVKLLNKLNLSKNYSLIYWLDPMFLISYSQGFVDSQFSFFILLSILLFDFKNKKDIHGYVIAGIPFAVAFLLKPQILIPFLALFVFFLINSLRHKFLENMFFFVPSTVLFLGYSLYFSAAKYFASGSNDGVSNFFSGFLALSKSYLDTINVMPCLTCSMPNIWYPISYLFVAKGQPVYTVTSRIFIAPNITVERLVMVIVILAIIYFCYLIAFSRNNKLFEKILMIMMFVLLIVPFIMTNAHINHSYLGLVLLIIYIAKYKNKFLDISYQLILFGLTGFIYIAYGFGASYAALPHFIRGIPLVYFSFPSIIGFLYIIIFLFRNTIKEFASKIK